MKTGGPSARGYSRKIELQEVYFVVVSVFLVFW